MSRRKLKRGCESAAQTLPYLAAIPGCMLGLLSACALALSCTLTCACVAADEYEVQFVGLHPEKNMWITRDK